MQTAKNAAVQTVSTNSSNRARKMLSRALLASSALVATANAAYALPSDPVVESGNINFQQPSSNHLVINNGSDKGIINWKGGFDIGANEITSINQNGAHAILLNKVYTGKMTEILGQLTSNGRVVVVNPNGVFFGGGSRVDVAGMIATTAGISNENFLKGNLKFDQAGKADASIINKGKITAAEGGLVALVAPSVRNDGVITAKLGTVALGAGQTFALDLYGDNLYSFKVGEAATAKGKDENGNELAAAIENKGKIEAQGGTVYLTANVAKGVVDHAINTTGIIEANSARVDKTGAIVLDGGDHGAVEVAGLVSAAGKGADQKGGKVTITGEKVTVKSGAKVDVSGKNGGGTALVGGDKQGKGSIRLAKETTLEKGATIDASTEAGTAGDVILWSESLTDFQGDINISSTLGDGGFTEVSSRDSFIVDGNIDLAGGTKGGSVLFDPKTITITNLPDSSGNITGINNVRASTLQNLLNAGGYITLSTVGTTSTLPGTGDINVLTALTWSGNGNLTLNAARDVNVTSDMSATGTFGNMTFLAVRDVNIAADITGGLGVSAQRNINVGSLLRDVTINSGNLTTSLTSLNGDINILAEGLGSTRLKAANSSVSLYAMNGDVNIRNGITGQDASIDARAVYVTGKNVTLQSASAAIGGDAFLRASTDGVNVFAYNNVNLLGGAFIYADHAGFGQTAININQGGIFFSDTAGVLNTNATGNGRVHVKQNVGGSIQSAINAIGTVGGTVDATNVLNKNAMVELGAGIFNENVVISRDMALFGAGSYGEAQQSTIVGLVGSPTISITGAAASGARLDWLNAENTGTSSQDAIWVENADNVKISNVGVSKARHGIALKNAKNAVIDGVTAFNTANSVMIASGSNNAEVKGSKLGGANGVAISYSNGANVHDNTLNGSVTGAKAVGANGVTFANNTVNVGTGATGLSVKDSSGAVSITGNTLTGNGDSNGIAVINTDGAQVTGNTIDFITPGAQQWAGLGTAIAVTDSDDVIISGGSIKSAGGVYNVKANNSDNLVVSGVTIDGGKIGVGLYNGSDDAIIYNNTISNQYVGIDAQGVNGLTASFNKITNAATGILVENASGAVSLITNTINSWINQVGIHVKNTLNAQLFDNQVDYADRGIWIDGSDGTTVFGGKITNSNTGIRVNPSDNVTLDGVTVEGGITGLELVDSTNVTVKNAKVTNAQTGIKFSNTSGEINKATVSGGTVGIDVSANAGTNRTVKITNKTKVTDFSNVGIQLSGGNLTANVDNTTVTGLGASAPVAQSGIYFKDGAKGSAKNNTLSNFASTNPNDSAAAIHIRNAGSGIEVSGNSITGTGTTGNYGVGVHVNGTNGTLIKNNTIDNTGWGISVNGANNVLDGNILGVTSANRVNAAVYGNSSANIKNNIFGSATDVSLELAGYAGGYVDAVSLTNNTFNFTTTFIRNSSEGLVVVSTPDKGNVFKKQVSGTYNLNDINDLLAMEDKIDHDMDHVSGYGHVVLKDGWWFATVNNRGIQRAIDLSANNGTVQAGAGTFNETLHITGKNVDLFGLGSGNGGTKVTAFENNTSGLLVKNANSNIKDIKFDGENKALIGVEFDHAGGSVNNVAVEDIKGTTNASAGLFAHDSAGRDLSITNSSFTTKKDQTGVHVKGYSDATLANLSISNSGSGTSAYGIWIDGNVGVSGNGTTVTGGSISGANVGIRINPSSYVGVSGVTVNGGSTAIELVGSDHASLTNNTINGASVGIKATANSHHLTATGNQITAPSTTVLGFETGKQGDTGILVENSETAKLQSNTITAYKTGISLKNSGNGSLVDSNTITAPTGIYALNGVAGVNLENSGDTTVSWNTIKNFNNGVNISASHGVAVEKNGITSSRNAGILAKNSNDLTLDGNQIYDTATLTGAGDGIRVEGGDNLLAKWNNVRNASGNGITILNGEGATLLNNTIFTARNGVVIKNRDNLLLQGNEADTVLTGFSIEDSDYATVGHLTDSTKGNIVVNGVNGIVVKNGKAIAVLGNNVTVLNNGIDFNNVDNSSITNNLVEAGVNGINLQDTEFVSVTGNDVNALVNGVNATNTQNTYIGANTILAATGVKLTDGFNLNVNDNTIEAAVGVDAKATSPYSQFNLNITYNDILALVTGVKVDGTFKTLVSNNQIGAGVTGVEATNANVLDITNNLIGALATGVKLAGGNDIGVDGNVILAGTGVDASNVQGLDILGNFIFGNTGVKLSKNTGVNNVFNNLIIALQNGIESDAVEILTVANNVILAGDTGVKLTNVDNVAIPYATTISSNLILAGNNGIDADKVDNLNVYLNGIFAANNGVQINGGSNAYLATNLILAGNTGVDVMGTDNVNILQNAIIAGNTGVKLDGAKNVTIWQNFIDPVIGIDSVNSNNVLIQGNIILASDTGIRLNGDTDVKALDNLIIAGNRGVDALGVTNLDILSNLIVAGDTGVFARNTSGLDVVGNLIIAGDDGVVLRNSDGAVIALNAIVANDVGVDARNSDTIGVIGNAIIAGNTGVKLRNSDNAVVGGNLIVAGTNGVDARNSDNASILLNAIFAGDTGVKLRNSDNAVLGGNLILAGNNGVDARNSDNLFALLNVIAAGNTGVKLDRSDNATFLLNGIVGGTTGIDATRSDNLTGVLNIIAGGTTGVKLNRSDNAVFVGNLIAGGTTGIDATRSDNLTGVLNLIVGGTTGVKLDRSDNATFVLNAIAGGNAGIDAYRSDNLTAVLNAVVAGDTGIRLTQSDDASLYGNLIVAQNNGVDVNDSQRLDARFNAIFGNGSANSRGINVRNGSDDAFIQANLIAGYDNGVRISNSDNATVRDNLLIANRRGVNVLNGSDNTLIDNNWVLFSEDGIVVNGGDSNTVSDNTVLFASRDGIRVNGTTNLDVHGNDVHFVGRDGINVANAAGASIVDNHIGFAGRDGLSVRNSNNATINQNYVHDVSRDGIHVRNSDDVTLDQNTVTGAGRDGVRLANSARAIITANNVSDSLNGIHLLNSANALVNGNTTTNNTDNGIWLDGSNGATVSANNVSGSATGVNVDGSNNATINGGNVINGNGTGIRVANGSANTAVRNNTISNNTIGLDALNVAGLATSGNAFTTNGTGLRANGVTNLTVGNDTFTGNTLAAQLINTNNATFTGTIFNGNAVGVNLNNSDNTRIDSASFTTPAGGTALQITNGSGGTIIKDVAFNGGNVAILIDGAGSDMQFEGNGSSFTGMNYYFVLQNGAMFGQTLDASAQIFDGTRASDFTLAQRDAAEAKTIDVEDVFSVGNVFYKAFPGDNSALNAFQRDRGDLFRGGLFSYAGRTISNDLTQTSYKFELGSVNLSLLAPAAGAATSNAAQFANLSTAAGGPGTGAGASADQLADISPAAGGATANCGNSFLGGGYTPSFSAATCSVNNVQ